MLPALSGPRESARREADSDGRLGLQVKTSARAAAVIHQNMFLLFAGISILICIMLFMIFCFCDLLERRQKRRREAQLVEQLVEQMLTPVPLSRYQPVPPPPHPARPSRPPESCPPPVPHPLPPTVVSAPGNDLTSGAPMGTFSLAPGSLSG